MMNQPPQLAKQALQLHLRLQDAAMAAALLGDHERSERLNTLAGNALKRYERRYAWTAPCLQQR